MKIHEHQAKEWLRRYGVAVPPGGVATTPDEALALAEKLGCPCAVKAQIHAGGRGKGQLVGIAQGEATRRGAGRGVQIAETPTDAHDAACELLGAFLVTAQTGGDGRRVGRVLVEGAVEVEHEFYLALVVDRGRGARSFVASARGGMDVEAVARDDPDAVFTLPVDPALGYRPYMGRRVARALGLGTREEIEALEAICRGIWRLAEERDGELVEINPLVRTRDGAFVALDGKIAFDDGALHRQAEVAAMRDLAEEDPVEIEAARHGFSYVKLDGTVGCMVNGAGLAMATLDAIVDRGVAPANFLDVGGGAGADTVEAAFRLILDDPAVEVILVNIFGGIVRCDLVARGILGAVETVRPAVPLVIRLSGNRADEGARLLEASGLDFAVARSFAEAADAVARFVRSRPAREAGDPPVTGESREAGEPRGGGAPRPGEEKGP